MRKLRGEIKGGISGAHKRMYGGARAPTPKKPQNETSEKEGGLALPGARATITSAFSHDDGWMDGVKQTV